MQTRQCSTGVGVVLAMACWQTASAALAAPVTAPALVEATATSASPLPLTLAATAALPTPVAAVAGPAVALPAAALGEPTTAELAAPPQAAGEAALAGVPTVPAERLDGLRGGSDTVNNDLKLSGVVGSNAAVNVASGANIINDGAFANASGLPIVIQNSGANVLIQNATIINLQLK